MQISTVILKIYAAQRHLTWYIYTSLNSQCQYSTWNTVSTQCLIRLNLYRGVFKVRRVSVLEIVTYLLCEYFPIPPLLPAREPAAIQSIHLFNKCPLSTYYAGPILSS